MASTVPVASTVSDPFNADSPMFLPVNHVRDTTNDTPRWTAAGGAGDADITAVGAPTSRAYDGKGHLPTFPSGTISEAYFNVQLNNVSLDTVVLILPVTLESSDIDVEIADDAAFTLFDGGAGVHTLASFSAVSGTLRRVGTSLPSALVTGVRYLRVHFARTGGGNYTVNPRLGELFVGAGLLLSSEWAFGGDRQPRGADVTEFVARSRARDTLVNARGFRDFRHDYEASENSVHGIDDVATIRSLMSQSEDGTQPVIHIPDPSSALGTAYFCKIPEDLRMPEVDHEQHEWSFEGDELPPFFLRES